MRLKMMNIKLILLVFFFSNAGFSESFCPTAPNEVSPSVEAKVNFDKDTGLYTYSYTLKNGRDAKLPISGLRIYTPEEPAGAKGPSKWIDGSFSTFHNSGSRIIWIAGSNRVAPGKSLSGFEITSAKEPGAVRFSARGPFTPPSATPTETDDEPQPDCPNFYLNESGDNGDIVGVTIGPAPEDQVSADILVRERKRFKRRIPKISPMSSGKVFVLVMGNEDLDVKDIDIDSLEFGFGKAKPLKHKIIFNKKPFKLGHFLRKHFVKGHKKSTSMTDIKIYS